MSRFVPYALFLAVIAGVVGFWCWLGYPVSMPPSPLSAGEQLSCVSYGPFRGKQTPFDKSFVVPVQQIEEDLAQLKAITSCVRIYSVDQGLDRVPEVARKLGMKVILGIWLGREVDENARQIEVAVWLANNYQDVIKLIMVGNEVLLRGEMAASDLALVIRGVKLRVREPVSYADVWEFWLKNPSLAMAVDSLTIHILPYWEDEPVTAAESAAHVDVIRRRMENAFPGKPILIGETGFPSEGRMREGARPSPSNQARVMHDLVAMARQHNYDVNYIEAFDQPWKRRLEGMAGGYWGLIDSASRAPKFQWGQPVSDYPHWPWRAAQGVLLSALVFGFALLTKKKQEVSPAQWAAVGAIALVGGAALGLALDMAELSVRNTPEALRAAVMLGLAVLVPVFGAMGVVRRRCIDSLRAVCGSQRSAGKLSWWLGLMLALTSITALQAALGLVFDARYRDFPASSLIGPVVALALVYLFHARVEGAKPGCLRWSESIFAATLAASGLIILVIEHVLNLQALGFTAVLLSLAGILLLARGAPAPKAAR